MRAWACVRAYHERVGQAASLLRRGDNDYSDMARPLAQCCWDNHSGRKDSDPPLLARGRGGWVSCVVLGVLPSRGSSLLAVLCPKRGAPVDCSPELPWENKEESYQRCLCRLKESAVGDCHRGSPLRSARSVHSDAVHAVSRLPEPSLRAQTIDPSTGDEGRLETKSPRGTGVVRPGPFFVTYERFQGPVNHGLTRCLLETVRFHGNLHRERYRPVSLGVQRLHVVPPRSQPHPVVPTTTSQSPRKTPPMEPP